MKARIKHFVLLALDRAAGQPMTESALISAVMVVMPECLVTEVRQCLGELEADRYLVAVRDELTGLVNFGLTLKGSTKAKTLVPNGL